MPHRALLAAAAIILAALATDLLGAALRLSPPLTDVLAIPIGLLTIAALVAWSSGPRRLRWPPPAETQSAGRGSPTTRR